MPKAPAANGPAVPPAADATCSPTRSGDGKTVAGADVECAAWTAADADDAEWVGNTYCRKAFGYDFPLCPYMNGDQRAYAKCTVPHCASGIFNNWETAPWSMEDLDWGLDRISR